MTSDRIKIWSWGGVAVAYVLLFQLNAWVFNRFTFSSHVNWIFLPAAVRMISVLLFSWSGVAGLYTGSLFISLSQTSPDNPDTWIYPALSSFSPMMAMGLGTQLMKVETDLEGLKAWQLLVFSLLGGAFNSLFHNLYFQYSGIAKSWMDGFFPMFVGDLAGTLIVLFSAAAILKFLHRNIAQ